MQLLQKTPKEEAAPGCLPTSPAHTYSGRNSYTGEAVLNTLLGLIVLIDIVSCLLSLGIITTLNKIYEYAMICPTSAMYLHQFCIHFQKLKEKLQKSSYHIPRVFAVCPYRSVEIILAEVFNQLIDNTSEKLIHIEEKMLSDMTQVASCKSIYAL